MIIIISYPGYVHHMKDVGEVMGLIQKDEVTLSLKYYMLYKQNMDYLGITILPGKLSADVDPTKAIQKTQY